MLAFVSGHLKKQHFIPKMKLSYYSTNFHKGGVRKDKQKTTFLGVTVWHREAGEVIPRN